MNKSDKDFVKSVDSFRMSAELMRDKEITMLRDEVAALKAQVNSLRNALSGYCSDESPDGWDAISAFTRTPQACLNDHNKRIEEDAINKMNAPLMVFGDDKIIVYSSSGKKYEYDLDGEYRGDK